jgi:hypothetical protein
MIDPLIDRAIALAFALLLGAASWHKLSGFEGFRSALRDYRLLPDALLSPAARAVPVGEAILAAGWLAGVLQQPVACATAALLGLYALAIAINLLRGRVHIGCGCGFGGSSNDQPISWWLVLRNLLLVAAALVPILPTNGRALGGLDWVTLAAALVASVLLYAGAGQLLDNRSAIQSWRRTRD